MSGRRHAAIAGVGSALPDRVVPNSFFESIIDTSDEWIRQRTGIAERRFAADGQATSDLATAASHDGEVGTMPTLSFRQLAFGILVGVFFAILQGDLPVPTLARFGIACSAPVAHGG